MRVKEGKGGRGGEWREGRVRVRDAGIGLRGEECACGSEGVEGRG